MITDARSKAVKGIRYIAMITDARSKAVKGIRYNSN